PADHLHCHYRDKALLLARGVPLVEFFNTVLCNGSGNSAGRQLSPLLSVPTLNVHSIVGPVANNALQAVGIAQQIREDGSRPLVLCSLGDGGTQQGEFLEAVAEAVRWTLPVLFLIEDNGYAISTRTPGRTFFSLPGGDAASFYGLPLHRVDGRDARACAALFGRLVADIRGTRGPALCVMSVERLADHSNADDERVYRDAVEREAARRTGDPVALLRAALLGEGVAAPVLEALEAEIESEVLAAVDEALGQPPPVATREAALPAVRVSGGEYRGAPGGGPLLMTDAFREVLRARLAGDGRVSLYGQDLEDPKGDVFGVTRSLSTEFPGRVRNSPLSEATILGTCIGRALAGGRPVAFLQFADFLPLAFNQLATELATMAWRTNGGWRAPVIVLAACGAYRPGLGPFHAHTFEALLAHLPGIDVGMPATAADAAGMLNAAFDSERPTVILYPKALLNDRTRGTSPDVDRQVIALGQSRLVRTGDELTLVGWGNTVPLCEKVADALAGIDVQVDVLDLRWLAPFDRDAVRRSARRTRRLLVVHEDNVTAGFGAEVIAAVAEAGDGAIQCRRLARPDTYVPCHFGNQLEILPSFEGLLTAAADMLDLSLHWERPAGAGADRFVVTAIGSSPADQQVEVVELLARVGDRVVAGQPLATLEADKAMVDLVCPADGMVEAIHLAIGDQVPVDEPLMTLVVESARQRQLTREAPGEPQLARRNAAPAAGPATTTATGAELAVVIAGLGVCRGEDRLDNAELLARFPEFAAEGRDGIAERTGITSRIVASASQDAVGMATAAATSALREAGVEAGDLDLVICSTSTPVSIVPSTACLVLQRIAPEANVPAYDLLAACSGYLYALSTAWDFLQTRPGARVLVLTTEVMRRVTNPDDPETAPIFGDAATATVLTAVPSAGSYSGLARVQRPLLDGRGEDGTTLLVPLPDSSPGARRGVRMEGRRVFSEAVRRMNGILADACRQAGIGVDDLDLIVPHQANGRIIEAMRTRLKLPPERVWNEIGDQGNTSSSTIPLALDTVLRQPGPAARIGLCAFGGGFTWAGGLLEKPARAGPAPESSPP
ncbi:MAG: beta-ketoacyl-ACP synthase 3, partial [Gammaproteobacteria bacterium]